MHDGRMGGKVGLKLLERDGTITLYDPEADGFKFHVIATTMAQVVLQRDTVKIGRAHV